MKSKVSIAHDEDFSRGIPAALDHLGELSDLFDGNHVAIKPNETWASRTDTTACTRADSVEAVIKYVKRFHPKKITVTGGAGAEETDNVFRLTGIDKVIEREGVEFADHNRPPFEPAKLDYAPQNEVMVNPKVFEYQTLVSLAQHKVHNAATVTLTMKNIAMSYPAADYYGHSREEMRHRHNFFKDLHSFIAGMCKRFPIHLGIIVGNPAMTQRGPIGGKVFNSGLTIAGRDFVAADFIGAKILGIANVRHIAEAAGLGLGKASLDEIEVVGVPLDEAIRIFKSRSAGENVVTGSESYKH